MVKNTVDVAAAVPRLNALRELTGDCVNVRMEVWFWSDGRREVQWDVWVHETRTHYKGDSLESALVAAERAVGALDAPSDVPALILPDNG